MRGVRQKGPPNSRETLDAERARRPWREGEKNGGRPRREVTGGRPPGMGQPSIRRVLCVAVGLYALFTLAAYHLWSAALDSPRSANERRADASAGANGQPRASRGRRGGAKSGARADERRAGAPEWPTNHRVDAFDVDKATADRAGGAPVDVHADVTLVDDARLAGHRKIAPRSGAALTRAAQATLAQVATGQRAGMDSMAGKAAGGAERVDRVRGDTPTQALAGAPRAPDAPSLDAEPPCPGAHPRYRIAIVIAWLGPSPAWFAHFAASAARSSYLVDFLLFHEGELDAPPVTTSARRAPLPRNVISINVGDGGLAAKFGFGMAKALGWQGASTRKLVAAFRVRALRAVRAQCHLGAAPRARARPTSVGSAHRACRPPCVRAGAVQGAPEAPCRIQASLRRHL